MVHSYSKIAFVLIHDEKFYLVVHVAVGEDRVKVFDALFRRPVVVIFESLFDSAEVHGMLDDLVIVGNVKLNRIDRNL